MIGGIGTDIIEIDRIRTGVDEKGRYFLDKLFTQEEQKYCSKYQDPIPHFAGRFAAKEAIAKALGVGFGTSLSFLDIEIINDEQGKPIVTISNLRITGRIHLTISHCRKFATATALWEEMLN